MYQYRIQILVRININYFSLSIFASIVLWGIRHIITADSIVKQWGYTKHHAEGFHSLTKNHVDQALVISPFYEPTTPSPFHNWAHAKLIYHLTIMSQAVKFTDSKNLDHVCISVLP